MGIEYCKYVWKNYKKQGGHKLVMLALADFASDDTGESWPSIATLAEMACVSERQVQKIIADLKQSGDIEVTEARGRNHTNIYKIIKKDELHDTFSEEKKVNYSTEKVNYSTEKVNYSTEKGELQFTRSTNDPSYDPPMIHQDAFALQLAKPVTSKANGKRGDPQTQLTKQIMEAYVEVRGKNGVNYGKEGAFAKKIAKEHPDRTIEKVKACYLWLKQDKFYEFKPVSLAKVYESIPEFLRYIEKRGGLKTEQPADSEWVIIDNKFSGRKELKNKRTGETKPYVNA